MTANNVWFAKLEFVQPKGWLICIDITGPLVECY